jgi:hypothetical protein
MEPIGTRTRGGRIAIGQLKRSAAGADADVGGAGQVAALQARVVRDADAGQDGDLLAAQPRHAAGAVVGQAHVGRLELGPAGGQELADLAAGVHPRQPRPACLGVGDPARVTFTGSLTASGTVLP